MSEILLEEVIANESGVSRRRVVAGVAWSLPVIATAIAAPAAAASGISATAQMAGLGSAITLVSSTGTGSGTNRTGTGPTAFQITNAGSALTGVVTGTVNIRPVGTVSAGVGIQSITSATLAAPAYTATHEFNATFTYAGGAGSGQTLNFPIAFQYERVSPAPSGQILSYALTITLRLPDNTDRTIVGTVTVTY